MSHSLIDICLPELHVLNPSPSTDVVESCHHMVKVMLSSSLFMAVLVTMTTMVYLAVHSVRCSNTVGAAGESFVTVVALHRLDGGVGGDHPLQGDRGHGAGSVAGGEYGDDTSDADDDAVSY